jgi:ribosomal protein L18
MKKITELNNKLVVTKAQGRRKVRRSSKKRDPCSNGKAPYQTLLVSLSSWDIVLQIVSNLMAV